MSEVLFLSSDPVLKEKNLEIMQQNGLDADGTSALLEGLIILDNNKYKVVVIDDELSDVSGYEACLKVRQQPGVLIVLLGSVPESDAWARVEELGFDLYLHKPVSPRELLARIKAMLRRPESDKEQNKFADQAEVKTQEQVAQVYAELHPFLQPGTGPGREAPLSETANPVQQDAPGQLAADGLISVAPAQPASGTQPQDAPSQQLYSRRAADQVKSDVAFGAKANAEQEMQSPALGIPVQQTYDSAAAVTVQPSGSQISLDGAQKVWPQAEVNIPKQVAPRSQEPTPTVVPPLERDLQRVVKGPVVHPSSQQQPAVPEKLQPLLKDDDIGAAILSDPRVIKLVDALVSGKLPDITPVIDFSYKTGYALSLIHI